MCLQQLGRGAESPEHLQRAAELQPANVQARPKAGLGLLRLGHWSEAAAHFNGALRLKPDHAEARQNLARARQ
ncbi:MAG: tetratricopeptide repeat protein [Verrucomicrobia bacterium]|nr:tetratricopeptide repeat protein [Verrucomicrobiota bacterium]